MPGKLWTLLAVLPLAAGSLLGMPAQTQDKAKEQEGAVLAVLETDPLLLEACEEPEGLLAEDPKKELKAAPPAKEDKTRETDTIRQEEIPGPMSGEESASDSGTAELRTVRSINTSSVGPEFRFALTPSFLDQLRSGSDCLYYSGSLTEADYALGEVVYDYCGLAAGGEYYDMADDSGTWLELTPQAAASLQGAVAAADSAWAGYRQSVAGILSGLDLTVSDRQLVRDIDAWICRNSSYQLVDCAYMPSFTQTGCGQCYQYAKLFADLCTSAGIPAWKVEGGDHAWDQYQIGGQVYEIDPTSDDINGVF